jgi:uncharacterized protein
MGTKRTLSEPLFLDSAYAIALASAQDAHHRAAAGLAAEIKSRQLRMATTEAVLLEIGNALAKPRFRPAAVALLDTLFSDPLVEVAPLTTELMQRGLELFRQRADKSWGLTDCVSFIVMQERRMSQALTTDEHFEQAGFEALLRDET